MPGLNVVALISGGKDSFFSLLHCQANGHTIVALANLHPPDQGPGGVAEDLDSFMYQTVGHQVIPCYEQALKLPLYRQEISGHASFKDKDYAADSLEDETESLLPLLRRVISAHPEANAVSTGAILSDYQRTRVESIALRLGLTPLSYLWQWPSLPPSSQASLLEDMAAVGQDSRIIKVASGGLDESFLGQNVADPRVIARLTRASQKFGSSEDGAVLGEGGEYETLAVAGPAPLWKGRISIPQDCRDVVPGEAGSAFIRITKPTVHLLADSGTPQDSSAPRTPPILDPGFETLQATILTSGSSGLKQNIVVGPHPSPFEVKVLDNLIGEGDTAPEQTRSIMDRITAEIGGGVAEITYSIIVLRNMGDFAGVNAVYGGYFTRPNPPARVTIACADVLPAGALLSISLTVSSGSRQGLHVQSRSYWAPANIGPYSQAIKHSFEATDGGTEASIYVAGQIPLIPASMQLPHKTSLMASDFGFQSVLALQHLDRIGRVMQVQRWEIGLAFVSSDGMSEDVLAERAGIAQHAWSCYHSRCDSGTPEQSEQHESDSEDFDVWHLAQRSGKAWLSRRHSNTPRSKGFAPIPEAGCAVPPSLVITADSLPRNADIEWVGFGSSSSSRRGDEPKVIPPHLRGLVESFRHRILSSIPSTYM